jgi:ABC-type antimicrobial peptide transport system permease subunit
VFGHGVRLLLIGSGVGLLVAIFTAALLRSILFETPPFEPSIYLGVILLLSMATALACWIPAARACRTDPMIVLRDS